MTETPVHPRRATSVWPWIRLGAPWTWLGRLTTPAFRTLFSAVVAGLTFFCHVDRAYALDSSVPLDLLERTSFRAREGAPGDIQSIAQTSDGFLWLGTTGGLYQFDGIDFRRYEPPGSERLPDSNIAALAAAPGGGLWATTRFGYAYFISKKTLRVYGRAQGLPEHSFNGLAVNRAGDVWIGSSFGVFRLDGDRWVPIPNSDGTHSSAAGFECLKVDGHGDLWIYDMDHIAVLRSKANRIELVRDVKFGEGIFIDAQGEAWISEARGIFSLWNSRVGIPASQLPGTRGERATSPFVYFVDPGGMAWGWTASGEVFRVPLPSRTRQATASSDRKAASATLARVDSSIRSFWLEDREGNIWMTSSSGLDRFRSTKLRRASFEGVAIGAGGVTVSDAGTLWTESATGLYRRSPGEAMTKIGIGRSVLCPDCPILAASDGKLYRRGWYGLERLEESGFKPVGPSRKRYAVHALTEDSDGRLWISVVPGGAIFQLRNGHWERFEATNGVPSEGALSMTSSGARVWLGYHHGSLAVVRGSSARLLDKSSGLDVGDPLVVAADGDRAWIGGTNGLSYFNGEKVRSVIGANGPWTGVSGIILTPERDLWLNSEEGIRRIPKLELDAFLKDPTHPVASDHFDVHSGIAGTPQQFEPLPTAARTPDGLLWFTTSAGIFWIDPRRIATNDVAPRVTVLSVLSNGLRLSGDFLRLPAGSSALEIGYTAPILGVPELAHFKYRLQGVDASWQDAGGRRNAFYTNLQPGSYRFQVMAANEDGVWSERSADVVIDIVPAYWQTTWFKAGAIASAALLVLFAAFLWYRIRVRLLARAMRLEAEIQQAERERIARDLHDTLLQNMYGLVWRMDVISRRFPPGDQNRAEMGEALDRAEKALGAGRERMFAPQDEESQMGPPLAERLSALGRTWSTDTGHDFQVDIRDERPLRSEVVLLLERVLSEAVVNAFRHSGATSVELSLHFDSDHLRCSVLDNGVGVPLEFLERPPDGHLGLRLMRDRAASIGASLRICRCDAGGTAVELLLPSRMAYARAPLWRRVLSKLFDRGSFSSSGASPRAPSHSTTKPTAPTIAPKNIALRKP